MIFKSRFGLIGIILFLMGCANAGQSYEQDNELVRVHARETVALTFSTLSAKLKSALSSAGVSHAVEYCNVKAIPLTDSLSQSRNVKIKRSTDRWRNPRNKASVQEMEMINFYKSELSEGKALSDSIVINGNSKSYYAPIRINNLCLNCHGQEKQISEYDFIKKLYPQDQAVNYSVGELRGIWSVSYYHELPVND